MTGQNRTNMKQSTQNPCNPDKVYLQSSASLLLGYKGLDTVKKLLTRHPLDPCIYVVNATGEHPAWCEKHLRQWHQQIPRRAPGGGRKKGTTGPKVTY